MPQSSSPAPARTPFLDLDAFDPDTGDLNVFVDTPKGSRNKFKYDEKLGLFRLAKVLPAGTVFPYDFGYVPSTRGEDGDPLDVLLLLDEPAFVGCLVAARLLGVVEAEQTERDGETTRNDRLVAVATASPTHAPVKTIEDLGKRLLDEVEHFFVSYNSIAGKDFKPIGRHGPGRAKKLVEAGIEDFRHRS